MLNCAYFENLQGVFDSDGSLSDAEAMLENNKRALNVFKEGFEVFPETCAYAGLRHFPHAFPPLHLLIIMTSFSPV